MERRAFLRGLLLAPVAVPVAAKAMAEVPQNASVMQFTAAESITSDKNGFVTGLTNKPLPVFTIANIDGEPRIAVRGDLISDLNKIATEQNARLA